MKKKKEKKQDKEKESKQPITNIPATENKPAHKQIKKQTNKRKRKEPHTGALPKHLLKNKIIKPLSVKVSATCSMPKHCSSSVVVFAGPEISCHKGHLSVHSK